MLDVDKYLSGLFISRLPDEIKNNIRKYGICNSYNKKCPECEYELLSHLDSYTKCLNYRYIGEYN